jgi:hypothetical protein
VAVDAHLAVARRKHARENGMVVLLPAPLGPRNPTISPRATSKDTSSMAVKAPKRLVSRSAEIMARSASIGK